jgi:hypothetical protein
LLKKAEVYRFEHQALGVAGRKQIKKERKKKKIIKRIDLRP